MLPTFSLYGVSSKNDIVDFIFAVTWLSSDITLSTRSETLSADNSSSIDSSQIQDS